MEVEGKFNYTTFSFNSTSIYWVPTMWQTLQALSVNKTRFLLCGSYLWKTDIQTSRMREVESAAQTQGEVPHK